MRVLVCGSRYWGVIPDDATQVEFERAERQKAVLFAVLDEEHDNSPFTTVIEGEAPGADTWGRYWAENEGIPVESYPADWKRFGKAAGPIRNKQMIDEGRPDFVIAFTNDLTTSRGTANMIRQAHNADIPVRIAGQED